MQNIPTQFVRCWYSSGTLHVSCFHSCSLIEPAQTADTPELLFDWGRRFSTQPRNSFPPYNCYKPDNPDTSNSHNTLLTQLICQKGIGCLRTTSGYRVLKPVGRGILAGRRRKFLIHPSFETTPQSHQKTKFSPCRSHNTARPTAHQAAKSPRLLSNRLICWCNVAGTRSGHSQGGLHPTLDVRDLPEHQPDPTDRPQRAETDSSG